MGLNNFLYVLLSRAFPGLRVRHARSLLKKQQYTEAIDILDPVVRASKQGSIRSAELAKLFREIGNMADGASDRANAGAAWKLSIKLQPKASFAGEILSKLGMLSIVGGDIRSGLEYFKGAVQAEWEFGSRDELQVAKILCLAANHLRWARQYDQAQTFVSHASECLAKAGSKPTLDLSAAYFELFLAASRCEVFDVAIEAAKRHKDLELLGPANDPASIGKLTLGLASMEIADGRYPEAIASLSEAQSWLEKMPTPDQSLILGVLACQMAAASFAGDWESGEQAALKAYEICQVERVEMSDHVTALNNLAYVMILQGKRLDEAARYIEEARTLAAGTNLESFVVQSHAALCQARGELSIAERLMQQAIRKGELRGDRAPVAEDVISLAEFYIAADRNAEAMRALEHARQLVRNVWRIGHPKRVQLERMVADLADQKPMN